jgi:DNA polymerase (family X)
MKTQSHSRGDAKLRRRALHRARAKIGNAQLARMLREMALFLEMEGAPDQPREYAKAARAVESQGRPLYAVEAEQGVRGICARTGIGKRIAERIAELLRTGRLRELDRLRRATPIDVVGLTAVEGLGPKTAKALFDELGIGDVRALEKACRQGRVRALPRFGAKREHRLLDGIAALAGGGARRPIALALPWAREIEARLHALPGVARACVAGSVRRRGSTIGNLDFVVEARDPARVCQAFASFPEVESVRARGAANTRVRLRGGTDADLRVVHEASFGAALLHFTGSAAHIHGLRRLAQRRNLLLSQHGLFRGERLIAGRTEAEVYAALGLCFVPPELREDAGEIEAARAGALPPLIEHGDLRGDLRVYTDGSAAAIEAMAHAAKGSGLEYAAVCVRPDARRAAREAERVLEHAEAVRAQSHRWPGVRLLTAAEVAIRDDGSLALADAVLAKLDVVIAALRDHLEAPRAEITRRVLRALDNPHVDLVLPPTAARADRREATALDLDAVIAAAKRTGTVLEISARPEDPGLAGEDVRKALDAGVRLAIDSGAHQPEQLARAEELGIAAARRGWARRRDVLNAFPVNQCLAQLKGGRAAPLGSG